MKFQSSDRHIRLLGMNIWRSHGKGWLPFVWPVGVVLAVWGTYFSSLFVRIIKTTSDGVMVGHENVWSDWALHIGLARIFATKDFSDWFDYHPVWSGGQLTYPFATDLISGVLMRWGVSLDTAFIWPSIGLSVIMLTGLYALLFQVTRSRWLPVGIIFLFFLANGLGWYNWASDVWTNPTWEMVVNPGEQYSRFDKYDWYSGNVIVGMLVPQRAFLLGLAMTAWILTIVVTFVRNPPVLSKRYLVVAGILAGLLPVSHMHSFIVVVIVSGFFCVSYRLHWRKLAWYCVPATIISVSLYAVFLAGGIPNPDFFRWFPGWGAPSIGYWLIEWWWQWGLLLPLFTISWFMLRKKLDRITLLWVGSLFAIFLVAQLFLFQPIKWDNSKLFVYAALGVETLVAIGIAKVWQRGFGAKLVVVLIVMALTLTGVLELIRLQWVNAHSYRVISASEIEFGEVISKMTAPNSVFLTAPTHNHPAMVWGARSVVMGYSAWAWNFGFDYQSRERDIVTLYQATTAVTELLQRYSINYVVFGSQEMAIPGLNESYYQSRYTQIYDGGGQRIYQIN